VLTVDDARLETHCHTPRTTEGKDPMTSTVSGSSDSVPFAGDSRPGISRNPMPETNLIERYQGFRTRRFTEILWVPARSRL
jgi:hypothetical protein